jgi:hypothetical protein
VEYLREAPITKFPTVNASVCYIARRYDEADAACRDEVVATPAFERLPIAVYFGRCRDGGYLIVAIASIDNYRALREGAKRVQFGGREALLRPEDLLDLARVPRPQLAWTALR